MYCTYHRCGSFTSVYKTKDKMFKEFASKSEAEYAWEYQDILSIHNLAPEVRSNVKRIRIRNYSNSKSKYRISNWGYYTEIAQTIGNHSQPCECIFCENLEHSISEQLEVLSMNIENVLGKCFCDSHIGNLGYITRDGQKLLVCIDTGMQSFGDDYYH